MSSRPQPHDPTARAVLQKHSHDPLGLALAQLSPDVAQCVVAHLAYQVPVAELARAFENSAGPERGGRDQARHVHTIISEAREHLRVFLTEAHALDENGEINWASSPAVRNLGKRLGISDPQPCQYCGERILSTVTPLGRPRSYCSNACRQAAYRYRATELEPRFYGVPNDARFELLRFVRDGTIHLEHVRLPVLDTEDPEIRAIVHLRWRHESPLRRAGLAALTLLKTEGIEPSTVRLHQLRIWTEQHQHAVGFECRYLPFMPKHFDDGGAEWLEVPAPPRTGPLVALRIRALSWRRPDRRRGTYFD